MFFFLGVAQTLSVAFYLYFTLLVCLPWALQVRTLLLYLFIILTFLSIGKSHCSKRGAVLMDIFVAHVLCENSHLQKVHALKNKNQQTYIHAQKRKKPVDQVKQVNVLLSIKICVAAYIKGNPYKLLNSVDSDGKLFICSKLLAVSNPGYDDLPLMVFFLPQKLKTLEYELNYNVVQCNYKQMKRSLKINMYCVLSKDDIRMY